VAAWLCLFLGDLPPDRGYDGLFLQTPPLVVTGVLILTAGFGEGHNAAARNIRDAIIARSPTARVEVHDVFAECYGPVNKVVQKLYLLLINRLPTVWSLAYHGMDRTRIVDWHIAIYQRASRRVEELINALSAHTVVSTYPGNNHLLDDRFRGRPRTFETITMITDSLSINRAWTRPWSDSILVANDETATIVRSHGVPAPKVHVTGFPVPTAFAMQSVNRPPPNPHPSVLYVINSGRSMAPRVVRELLGEQLRLTVTVGRDEALGRTLENTARSMGRPLTIHGWTDAMPKLMAENHVVISKAGGATVQECLAAKTPMIITQVVPGQEAGNATLILNHGAGTVATRPTTIRDAVGSAFANHAALWKTWHGAATSLSRPDAANAIAERILAAQGE
jgi:processive 1,2-diacylglycerol beta-glucosyltransferase